mgnify:CR=1 FL=1
MNTYDDADMTTQLQQVYLDERPSNYKQELALAVEAQHRLRLLNGDGPRLEDLAGEWIELLRASRRKTSD